MRQEWTDLAGPGKDRVGAGVAKAGRKRTPLRLMIALLVLQYLHELSDAQVVKIWSENQIWQYFSGIAAPRNGLKPCCPSLLKRYRQRLKEEGCEEILATTIQVAVQENFVAAKDFERVSVDTTVQEKAVTYPTDSKLLERLRQYLVSAAKRYGIPLKQTFDKEGPRIHIEAARKGHTRQTKAMQRCIKRQSTIAGLLMREMERKAKDKEMSEADRKNLNDLLELGKKIIDQIANKKRSVYSVHAPEVEAITKGKIRHKWEYGVKVGIVTLQDGGLIAGARSFPGTPYDGNTLNEQLEQCAILIEGTGGVVKRSLCRSRLLRR